MAHTCPDCGQACYCSGDCEDHDTGGEFEEECVHYLRCENTMEDDGGWEPEGWEEREQDDKERGSLNPSADGDSNG